MSLTMMKTAIDATWVSDQGDGTFLNPVLHADYSDPDVIRVGCDFYMTASSFSHTPGLPILHSQDLVNWTLIQYAIPRLESPRFDIPQHGDGVWAPSIRHHDGKFWIFYGDPDSGIYMTTALDPAGEWSASKLVHAGVGLIDPCPFWDDDGQAYLVHAFANSRCGIKSKLRLCPMSPDGTRLLDEGAIVFDGTVYHPTIEGPKMYKRGEWYYIMAPAGGVATGWQTVLRASTPYGPYEDRIVMHQGGTQVNGPHQGGWVELESGESWFLHFQDKGAYGRVAHLQPMTWADGWPIIGVDRNGDGIGEPVERMNKPEVGGAYPIAVPAMSDSFESTQLGLQWQWQGNAQDDWYSLLATQQGEGFIRLFPQPLPNGVSTIYDAPNLLMQKFPAESFRASVRVDAKALAAGEEAGLVVHGFSHARIGVRRDTDGTVSLIRIEGDTEQERVTAGCLINEQVITLRVTVMAKAVCEWSWSMDGVSFERVGQELFTASKSRWVGAKVGLYALTDSDTQAGFADFSEFRMESASTMRSAVLGEDDTQ